MSLFFQYVVKDVNSKTQQGIIEATNEDAAVEELHKKNLVVISIKTISKEEAGSFSAPPTQSFITEQETKEEKTESSSFIKYPILSLIIKIHYCCAVASLLISAIIGGGMIWNDPNSSWLLGLSIIVIGIILFSLFSLFAESINLIVDIEQNTRNTTKLLSVLINNKKAEQLSPAQEKET